MFYSSRQTNTRSAVKFTAYLLCCLLSISSPLSFAQSAPGQAATPAGKVVLVNGEVIARDAGGSDRLLARSDAIFQGDTLFTAPDGSAQIRMVDGALIALKEDTSFAILAYRYEENVATDVSTLELIEGGFRTISGSIGSQNRDAYETRIANFATIGIRGTDYEVVITPAGTVVTGVYDGGTTVSNGIGTLDLGVGANFDFAEIPDQQAPPRGLLLQPNELGNIPIAAANNTAATPPGNANAAPANAAANANNNSGNTNAAINAGSLAPPAAALIADTPAADIAGNQLVSQQQSETSAISINPTENTSDASVSCSTNSSACVQLTDGTVFGNSDSGSGNSDNSNAGGNGNTDNSNAGGNGNTDNSNAGGNGNSDNSNAGGNGNADNSNAGGNGNSGNNNAGGNGNSGNNNAGGNGNSGNSNAGGNGNSGNSNAGGNSGNSGNDNSGNGNSGNNGNGNSDNSGNGNAGGNSGNSGNDNSGNGNSGNSGNGNSDNSGNGNSGNGNSDNTDNGNSGNGNSGSTGGGNSGNSNSGTSGNGNSGNTNSGTSGNGNSGNTNSGTSGNGNSNGNNNSGSGNSGNTGSSTDQISRPNPSVADLNITWGRWDASLDKNWGVVAQSESELVVIAAGDYFAEVNPANISHLTGSHDYATTIASAFIGSGSAGDISSLIASMQVDFSSGSITAGSLKLAVADQVWSVHFDGQTRNGSVVLNAGSGTLFDNTGLISDVIDANLSGTFSGPAAEAFVGGFELLDQLHPFNTVEGIYTIER